ncbi:MAG TPA: hypothetical protein VFL13_07570 [Candidatus Baltobacteraceae bacterium]|nr:hypothetical protein [Candidatus Baltobacteraceae bacterium]
MDDIFAVLELAAEQRRKQLQAKQGAAPAAPAAPAVAAPVAPAAPAAPVAPAATAVQPIASVSDAPALPDPVEAPQPQTPVQPQVTAAPRPVRRPAAQPLQGMFEDGNTLLRAVIASEVLAPPRALRGENALWSLQPNEP